MRQYRAVFDRQDWCGTVHVGLDPDSDFFPWFAANVAARLLLRAFADLTGDDR
ncbi:hypothetical protein ACLQ28_33415 [Micromonospora sp. DT201]|uniref:hypothetical protein n=1 Tax=Micromonospora sp. DT201 TaxID=3393442 RepID=UPI003CE87187